MASSGALHVAVGVVRDSDGNILITQRAKHAHQGGLWEFPGGKLEHGEEVLAALRRELREEVGILIDGASPLIKIHHHYPDLEVLLDVWRVDHFSGQACACEGQAMRWVASEDLNRYEFPVANRPIIAAAQLPDRYAILEGRSVDQVLANLSRIIGNGVRLLQLRVKSLPASEILTVYATVFAECQRHGVKLLLNSDLPLFQAEADGIHLSSHALMMANQRPENYAWVAASCHDLKELEHAQSIGVDFAVLAPVLPTASHPGKPPLGWQRFSELLEVANLPVFALGGLSMHDLDLAQASGAQGIAGISGFLG